MKTSRGIVRNKSEARVLIDRARVQNVAAYISVITSLLPSACASEPSCIESATCPPTINDQRDASADQVSLGPEGGPDSSGGARADASTDDATPRDQNGTDSTRDRGPGGDGPAEDGRADISIDTGRTDASGVDGAADIATIDQSIDGAETADASFHDSSVQDDARADAPPDVGAEPDVMPPCDPTSCPTGCCDANGQCVTSSSNSACGKGGIKCQTCSAGQECDGTSCVCTPSSCSAGCCDGAECKPFSQQSDTMCGAARVCAACGMMQQCDKSNGQCVCNAASCPSGCCDSNGKCVVYGGQSDQSCGAAGAKCAACDTDKYCADAGTCAPKNWCRKQTIPSGVDIADYQCIDFDTGSFPPSGWTQTEKGNGIGQLSSAQASSVPNSLYSAAKGDPNDTGTLNWSNTGANPVSSASVAADVYRVGTSGYPGNWTGYLDILCSSIGNAQACIYCSGASFGVAYWNSTSRVDCGSIGDIPANRWTQFELQIQSDGTVELLSDGMNIISCNQNSSGYPPSNTGSVSVGLRQTDMALGREIYVDNVIATLRR
jgi:hypothetical protein